MGRRAATIGMFDGVHEGHKHVLRQLCDLADERGLVPTVFTFDRHPAKTLRPDKAPKMLTTPAQRTERLVEDGAKEVMIFVFNEALSRMSAVDFLTMLKTGYAVDMLLVGYNHRFGHDSDTSIEYYREAGRKAGVEVIQAQEYRTPQGEAVSSSMIRRLLGEGNIREANRLLGHPFALRGKVQHGSAIGRTIGFPTANLKPLLADQLIPANGVYAAVATLPNGKQRAAMVNIGTNPTVGGTDETRIEANILDFDGDLYGQPVELTFIDRIRDERTFPDLDALASQINSDKKKTISIIGRYGHEKP